MLKYLIYLLFITVLCCNVSVQGDTTQLNTKDTATVMNADRLEAYEPDDEFNIFLMVIAVGFAGAALGAVMAGAFAVFLLLSIVTILTAIGILSASLLIGLHKRSLQAGFKSLLLILSGVLGTAIGLFVLWFIDVFFHLHLAGYQLLLAGAGGGLMGGLLLGFITYRMIKTILKIAFNKLQLAD